MLFYSRPLRPLKLMLSLLMLAGFSLTAIAEKASETTAAIVLDVYKDANCGCCNDWLTHADERGFTTRGHNINNLYQFKLSKGIAQENQSCHTAVSSEGYVFEGHVPARYMQRFLSAPPAGAIGLAVPAMPMGSPGMEYQNKFEAYEVLLLMKDGSSTVYAQVNTLEDSVR